MNRIDKMPNLDWADHSASEIARERGDVLIKSSDVALQIGDVAIGGLIYHTLTSPPWLWFALAKGVTLRDLIDFRRMQTVIPVGTLTAVSDEHTNAKRFAVLYGFEETGETHLREGIVYRVYRKK